MFKSIMDLVFAGCVDYVDKFFCMMMFLFGVEILVGLIDSLMRGVRSR